VSIKQGGRHRSWIKGAAGVLLFASSAAYADTYTYNYVGPTFTGGTDHVEISFTTSAPLATSRSYLSSADAAVISGAVNVVGPAGTIFSLPLSTFQVHTSTTASSSTPGIDSWFIIGDVSSLTGTSPTMTGYHIQAYSMNTLAFIPGSDIPGAIGLVTGAYDYDQATKTTFYASCSGVTGCTLAGNGQPYVGNYSGIINPSRTSAASWTLASTVTTPPPAPLAVSGTLPDGTVGIAYNSSALTASGGVPPYTWSATGLPTGLAIDPNSAAIFGTPSIAGTYSAVNVTATDSSGVSTTSTLSVVILAPLASCSGTNAPITGVNKFWLDLNGGLKNGGQSVVYTPTPSGTTFTGGTTTFLVGELVDYVGTVDGIGMCDATTMTVKPAAPTYSCTKPAGSRTVEGKGKITKVGAGYIVVGTKVIQTPSCTQVSWNGATHFAVGQAAEYKGYVTSSATIATSITIN
jgi:hypothetical protein